MVSQPSLASTMDAAQLIPGDLGAMAHTAELIQGYQRDFGNVAELMGNTSIPGWDGPASDTYVSQHKQDVTRWQDASVAFSQALSALETYASAFSLARLRAENAAIDYANANAASQTAHEEHVAEVARVKKNAPSKNPKLPQFFDPGDAMRATAESDLLFARQALISSGDESAAEIGRFAGLAPEQSFWDYLGDFFNVTVDLFNSYSAGFFETVGETVTGFLGLFTVQGIEELGEFIKFAFEDPLGAGGAIVGEFLAVDKWGKDPGGALGTVVVNVGLIFVPGGIIKNAVKAPRMPKVPTKIAEAISQLKNVGNFKPGGLAHIFNGVVNPKGVASGFHSELLDNTPGRIVPGTKTMPDANGVYEAKVEVVDIDGNVVPKKANNGYSTFFPEKWSMQETIDKINEAYANREIVTVGGNEFKALVDGVDIRMYLDGSGRIISAFPQMKGTS